MQLLQFMKLPLEIGHVEAEVTTIGDLIDEFYCFHTLKKSEKVGKFKPKRIVLRPRTLILNPELLQTHNDIAKQDKYFAIYYQGFYVTIEHGRSIGGPHKLELWKQIKGKKKIRLACWTALFFFFKEEKIRKLLKRALKERLYYASDYIRKTPITLEEEKEGFIIV